MTYDTGTLTEQLMTLRLMWPNNWCDWTTNNWTTYVTEWVTIAKGVEEKDRIKHDEAITIKNFNSFENLKVLTIESANVRGRDM